MKKDRTKAEKKGVERKAKDQFNIRLPSDVINHCARRYLDTGVHRGLQALAGLIAFELLPREAQGHILQCATRVERGEISWDALEGALDGMCLEAVDEKVLRRMIEHLIEIVGATEVKRRLG